MLSIVADVILVKMDLFKLGFSSDRNNKTPNNRKGKQESKESYIKKEENVSFVSNGKMTFRGLILKMRTIFCFVPLAISLKP
jgi:hypothetical protein